MHISVKTMVSVCVAVLIVGSLLAFALSGGLTSAFQDTRMMAFIPEDGAYEDRPNMDFLSARAKPVIKINKEKVRVKESHPAASFIESVTDADGNDISGSIEVKGEQLDDNGIFLAEVPGIYYLTFSVTDSHGIKEAKTIRVMVEY